VGPGIYSQRCIFQGVFTGTVLRLDSVSPTRLVFQANCTLLTCLALPQCQFEGYCISKLWKVCYNLAALVASPTRAYNKLYGVTMGYNGLQVTFGVQNYDCYDVL